MATTVLSLITEARYLMNDASKKFYSDDEMLHYCNSGLRFLASELLLWKNTTDIVVQSDKDIYTLPYSVVLPIMAYDNSGNRRPINEENYRHLSWKQNEYENDTTYSVSPLSLFLDTPTSIQVVQPNDTDIISFDYYYQPSISSVDDILPISGALENLVILYIQTKAIQKQKGQIGQWDISMIDRVMKSFDNELARWKSKNPEPYIKIEMDDKLFKKGLF